MHRTTAVITSVIGAGAAALCLPDIQAYRRLIAITRSIRDQPPPPEAAEAARAQRSAAAIPDS